jgi:mannose-6-phosphate isomerase-like protein (cupin superfamily)
LTRTCSRQRTHVGKLADCITLNPNCVPTLIPKPTTIPVPGNKRIDEYIGNVNSATAGVSIAHMRSPAGWIEPGQRPDFDEFTIVLQGMLRVQHEAGVLEVHAGQALIAHKGEWVRYDTPNGAEYIAVCIPAFTLPSAHRDPDGV